MEGPKLQTSELEAGHGSLSEPEKMFEMQIEEKARIKEKIGNKGQNEGKMKTEEKTVFLEKVSFAGAPVIAIALAEMLIFGGKIREAAIIYTLLLLTLSFSIMVTKKIEIRKVHQAFMLLPILRLINLSMPIFFDVPLYSFIFIYAPLAIPATIASIHQKIRYETKRELIRRIGIYLPASILAGLVFGEAEYLFVQTTALVPDLSLLNLLKLVIIMIFVVGLVEELIFRAILQTRLEELFGAVGGIFLASLLFGLMHSIYGTPYEIVYTLLVGAFLGYLFHRTRSLALVTMIHGSINVFLFGVIPHLGSLLGT